MALTSARSHFFIAGITFLVAMAATPSTPQRILPVTFCSVLRRLPHGARAKFKDRQHEGAPFALFDIRAALGVKNFPIGNDVSDIGLPARRAPIRTANAGQPTCTL